MEQGGLPAWEALVSRPPMRVAHSPAAPRSSASGGARHWLPRLMAAVYTAVYTASLRLPASCRPQSRPSTHRAPPCSDPTPFLRGLPPRDPSSSHLPEGWTTSQLRAEIAVVGPETTDVCFSGSWGLGSPRSRCRQPRLPLSISPWSQARCPQSHHGPHLTTSPKPSRLAQTPPAHAITYEFQGHTDTQCVRTGSVRRAGRGRPARP